MRVIFCTHPKCGSQWLRDLLSHPRVLAASGLVPGRIDRHFPPAIRRHLGWEAIPDGTFLGPVYTQHIDDVLNRLGAADRVVQVDRDPRDRAVSMLFSLLYSHRRESSLNKRVLYGALTSATWRDRYRLVIWLVLQNCDRAASWAVAGPDPRVLRATYEQAVQDSDGFLVRCLAHLGVELSLADRRKMVEDLSFATRSGRQQGEEDIHSHYRRGEPGDWKRHFDRRLGQEWEEILPGFLQLLGYETTSDWWQSLPEHLPQLDAAADQPAADLAALAEARAEVVRTKEQAAIHQRAAAERLEALQRLNATCQDLQRRLAEQGRPASPAPAGP